MDTQIDDARWRELLKGQIADYQAAAERHNRDANGNLGAVIALTKLLALLDAEQQPEPKIVKPSAEEAD